MDMQHLFTIWHSCGSLIIGSHLPALTDVPAVCRLPSAVCRLSLLKIGTGTVTRPAPLFGAVPAVRDLGRWKGQVRAGASGD
jgi:hypothetical protein